ncbi:hypothetical protein [Absidia glauca]|uniref:Ubiquitin-like domain-containing protein n=1 Tax=Absidia glauca TaxID=4829 RepID=A0A168PU77_ABSGL|nr:hypothetical protein [Absidia glauca]
MTRWTLQVKSLDRQTQSVTVASTASVLQLKEAIQPVFDIASHRQRLIFQGKVLKDGKQLTEYANLQDGKIIHLVSRPADAPANPVNDDPQTQPPRGATPHLFPNMFGPSEGYTFITVDANISDLGENNSALSSLLSSLFDGEGLRTQGTPAPQVRPNTTEGPPTRSLFNMDLNAGSTGQTQRFPPRLPDFSPVFDGARQYFNSMTSFETRVTRVLAAMENIQTNLEASPTETDADQLTWSAMTNAHPEQIQLIRSRLRAHGITENMQIGLALSNLTDLMVNMVPRLRQLAQNLQAETTLEPSPELRRMVAIIRIVSMVHHAIGNIMAGSENPSRRTYTPRSTRQQRRQQATPPQTTIRTPSTARTAAEASPAALARAATTARATRVTAARAERAQAAATRATAATAAAAEARAAIAEDIAAARAQLATTTPSASTRTGNKRQTRSSTAAASSKRQRHTSSTPPSSSSSSSSDTKKGKGKRRDDTAPQ